MPIPPHTLIVTEDPLDGARYFRLECDGVTDWCRSFEECQAKNCDHDALEESSDEAPVAHGVAHRYIGNLGWSVEIPGCALKLYDNWTEEARELNLEPGTHRVVHAWEDGGEWFSLQLAEPVGATA